MYKILIFFFILNFYNLAEASLEKQIISKIKKIDNLTFNFKQSIEEKNETGKCVIKYPKKIFCEYENINKKIIVSNGRSLVIKNRNSGTYYLYPLEKTPLIFLLDKEFLIKILSEQKPRNIEDKYLNFRIYKNDNIINIFFDKKTLDLIGWQTEDIYQNLIITFISSVKLNQKIDDDLFKLPEQ